MPLKTLQTALAGVYANSDNRRFKAILSVNMPKLLNYNAVN
jgi:hypothetical protein